MLIPPFQLPEELDIVYHPQQQKQLQGQLIGQGHAGKVYNIRRPSHRQIIRKYSNQIQNQVNTYQYIQGLQGKPLQGTVPRFLQKNSQKSFQMQKLPNTQSLSRLDSRTLSERQVLEIVIQLVRKLELLHKYHVVLMDIKPDNIIVTKNRVGQSDESIDARYIDLEKARVGQNLRIHTMNPCGTIVYNAPQCMTGKKSPRSMDDLKAMDMWSLGMTLGKFVGEVNPIGESLNLFQSTLRQRYKQKRSAYLETVLRSVREKFSANFTSLFMNIITNLLIINPKQRKIVKDPTSGD